MSVYVRVGVVTGRLSRGIGWDNPTPLILNGGAPFNIYSKSVFVRGYFLSLLSDLDTYNYGRSAQAGSERACET